MMETQRLSPTQTQDLYMLLLVFKKNALKSETSSKKTSLSIFVLKAGEFQ